MAIITISRGSYSHGRDVAEKTARALGYVCVSRGVLIEVSKELNIPEIKLTKALEASPSLFDKYTFGREKYIAYMRAAILDSLAKDNVVYHGFAGHFFVKDLPHVMKVRIIADMEDRIRCMMARENVSDRETARKMVKSVDEARRKWSIGLYSMDTWDCRLYDLVINIGKVTIDDAVDMICRTAQSEAFQTTPESRTLLETMAREAREKLKGMTASPFFEPMRAGPWKRR